MPGMHNTRPGSGPRMLFRPSQPARLYKKIIVNDGDFINEFKLVIELLTVLQTQTALMATISTQSN